MNAHARAPLSIYVVAAEESGDALGAALARALTARAGGGLRLAGVGGRAMAEAGISSPFPIDDLSIIGVAGIPRRLPTILRRIRETADAVIAQRPDALVIVDSPDFTHRVARRVRRAAPDIPIIDYVSPSVWAWRPARARAMRAYIDHVLAILPFEPAVHVKLGGPPCHYVGHPLAERVPQLRPSAEEAKRRNSDPPLVLVLPGSRASEIKRLLAIFGAAIAQVSNQAGPLEIVLPTVPHLETQVRNETALWPLVPQVVSAPDEKAKVFRAARAALAASGTVTLELALAGVPMVTAYKLSAVEAMILRGIGLQHRLSSVILANLVLGENAVPEFLQEACVADRLADALVPLLSETTERRRQIAAFTKLDGIMEIRVGVPPSAKAAAIILDVALRGRRNAGEAAVAVPC